jgi:hypothetical protein
MTIEEYADMIWLEAMNLKEEVHKLDCQTCASLLKKHCTKIRHDLHILDNKLGNWDKNSDRARELKEKKEDDKDVRYSI